MDYQYNHHWPTNT